MKKFSKKLLSILVSIAMLIGIALPAGVVSASTSEDPTVTMVDFDLQADGETATDTSDGGSYYIGVAKCGAGTEASPYVLSFDYYMPNASNVKVRNIGGDAGNGTWLSGSDATLQQGYHTFSASFSASNGAFYSRLVIFGGSFLADKDDVIYVWNITVTKDGEKCEIEPHSSDSTVYVNSTKTLSQYDWAKPTLSVSTLPTKTTYAFGEKLDTTGMVVTLSDIFGNTETIAAEDYTVGGFDSSTVGEKTVTVTYGDYSTTFTVTVGDPTITKVDFTKLAAHITDTTKSPNVYAFVYHIGKSTEAEPFTVHFKYYLPGDSTVTVENSGNHCTRTGGSDYILLKGYNVFEATYVSKETGTLFVPWLVCSNVDTQIYIWDVSVTKNGKAVSDYVRPAGTYPVKDNQRATATEVGTLSSQSWAKPTLSVSTLPTKTTYALGEKLDTTGMVVTLSDIFGKTETIPSGYTVSELDSAHGGEKTITVTYGDYTATFTVTVIDPTVTAVDFSTGTTWKGATIDLTGGSATNTLDISFDYYLPKDSQVRFRNSSAYFQTAAADENASVLYPGYHTLSIKQYVATENPVHGFKYTPTLINLAKDTTIYIWNYQATFNGTSYTMEPASGTDATVTTDKTLSGYDWSETMSDTIDGQKVYKIEGSAITPEAIAQQFETSGSVPIATINVRNNERKDTVWYYAFDYYMSEDAPVHLYNCNNGKALELAEGYTSNITLQKGFGKAEAYLKANATADQYGGIELVYDAENPSTIPDIYIWNFRFMPLRGPSGDAHYFDEIDVSTMGGMGKDHIFTMTMSEAKVEIDAYEHPTVTGITVTSAPTKTTYELGESLDATGLAVAKTLSNGKTETIAAADYTVAGYDSAKFGEQTVTVFYGSYTATFTVTVNDPTVIAINYDLQADGETATDTSSNWSYNLAFFYKSATVDNPYTLSFDYYMPNANTANVNIEGGDVNGTPVDSSVSTALQQGYHTFSNQYYTNSNSGNLFAPRLRVVGSSLTAGADDIIYIWNLKVTQGGTEVDRKPKASTVYADSSMTLSEYSWSKYIDDEANYGMAFKLNFSDLTTSDLTANDVTNLGYNGSVTVANSVTSEWTYSFEYYMPEESAIYLRRGEGGSDGLEDETTGSIYLQQGRHTYSATFTPSDYTKNTTPGFGYTYSTANAFEGISDLYIWNITLTNGTTVKQVTPKTTWVGLANTVAGLKELIPVAEVMAAMASDATPTVTKIDFGTPNENYEGTEDPIQYAFVYHVGNADASTPFVVRFEYYLPVDSAAVTVSDASGKCKKIGGSDTTLLPGHNVFEATYTGSDNIFVPRLYCSDTSTDIYIWDVSVTKNGKAVSDYVRPAGTYPVTGYQRAAATEVGLLTAQDWYSTMDDPTVTKLDFDNVKADYVDKTTRYHSLGMYSYEGTKDTTPVYEVSFDYYLPNDCGIYVEIIGGDSNGTPVKGYTPSLEQGRHTFSCEYTMPNYLFAPAFTVKTEDMSDSVNEVIYVWNYRITKNGGLMNPNSGSSAAGTVASYQYLNSATFVVPAADMIAAEETENLGAQLRISDKSIRFVGAIECDGVEYNPGADAGYNDATITVDGKVYELVGAGMVFTRSKKLLSIPELALRLGKSNVYNVPAKKIQSPANAEQLGFKGEGIVFTAVIMNIPRENWDETLSARPYVKYIDKNGDEQVLYGDIVSRSVMQVKEVTDSEGPSSSMDKEAEDRRNEILGNIEAAPTSGTVYYVDAVNGDDSNDGMSENSAWKTLDKVNEQEGSESTPITVLFKRGDTWRGTLTPTSYTTYGAYGSGDKPQILGSMMNYANAEEVAANGLTWTLVNETLNKWQLEDSGEYLNKNAVSESTTGNNVGAIFFFDADKKLIANGKMSTEEDIYAEYAFYQQINYGEPGTVGDLYVCLPTGMTPESYADIEISTNTVVIGLPNYADNNHITIDNLCLKYGTFGIAAHGHYVSDNWAVNDLTVTNCEIAYIGGAMSGTAESHVRYGNGIEIYGPCNEVEVRNNWIHQCYDAGYSNQGEIGTQQNISVTGNLIEYCNYSLEIWMNATTGLIKDADYSGNMLRFAGYQFERDNRIGGSTEAISHLNFFFGAKPCINVTVADNIIDTSYRALVCVAYPNSTDACKGPKKLEDGTYEVDAEGNYVLYPNEVNAEALSGPTISGNTWIQGYDRYSFVAYMKDKNVKDYEVQELPANNQNEMVASVSAIDTAPEAIKLDK